jgi:hypothetical protein
MRIITPSIRPTHLNGWARKITVQLVILQNRLEIESLITNDLTHVENTIRGGSCCKVKAGVQIIDCVDKGALDAPDGVLDSDVVSEIDKVPLSQEGILGENG